MQGDWLSRRVTMLEQQLERLAGLPADVTALRQDMAGLRADMDAGFAAMRAEMDARSDAVDIRFDAVEQVLISLQTQIAANHRHMLLLHEQTMAKIDDNHRRMLVLHEDVISTIATLGEAPDRPKSRPRKKR